VKDERERKRRAERQGKDPLDSPKEGGGGVLDEKTVFLGIQRKDLKTLLLGFWEDGKGGAQGIFGDKKTGDARILTKKTSARSWSWVEV